MAINRFIAVLSVGVAQLGSVFAIDAYVGHPKTHAVEVSRCIEDQFKENQFPVTSVIPVHETSWFGGVTGRKNENTEVAFDFTMQTGIKRVVRSRQDERLPTQDDSLTAIDRLTQSIAKNCRGNLFANNNG